MSCLISDVSAYISSRCPVFCLIGYVSASCLVLGVFVSAHCLVLYLIFTLVRAVLCCV